MSSSSSNQLPSADNSRIVWAGFWIGLTGFLALVLLVRSTFVEDAERLVLLALRERSDLSNPLGPEWFEAVAGDVTALGGFTVITLALILVMATLTMLRHGSAAIFLGLSLLSGTALSTGLKLFFERARPEIVPHADRVFTQSFPSGHAMMSMVAWMLMAAIAVRFVPSHGLRLLLMASAFALSILIGASRVYLGVHWPTDVLAGWLLGLFWASACWLLAHTINQRQTLGHSRI